MKPGTVEGIDIFNNWKWNIYEIRIFTASKPKEKIINKLERNKTYVSLFSPVRTISVNMTIQKG